jgi:hypothetical protein
MGEKLTTAQVNRKVAEWMGYSVRDMASEYSPRVQFRPYTRFRLEVTFKGGCQAYADCGHTEEAAWSRAPRYTSSLDSLRPVLERIAEDDVLGHRFDEAFYAMIPASDAGWFSSVAEFYCVPTETIARAACEAIGAEEDER